VPTTPKTTKRIAAMAALTLPLAFGAGATGTAPEPATLRMARTTGFADAQIDHFTNTLAELSGGELKIEIATEWDIGWTATDVEQQIAGAVADGDVDLGWVGSRAFGELGVTSLSALTAPLLVDNYPLQAAILASDIPERMLAGLDDIGVTGLGVLGGGLRKPIGVDGPLLGPNDFAGATFHAFPHGGHEPTLTALGATTASGTFDERDAGLLDGTIDGYENTLLFFQTHVQLAQHITLNVDLWPATGVVFANPDSLAALDDTQQEWLRAAVSDTVARSVEIAADVDTFIVAGATCAAGEQYAVASDIDLAAMRDAVEPVYTELQRDADTAGFIAEIEQLKSSTTVEPPAVPNCAAAESAAAADEALPDGIYRSAPLTAELVAAALGARGLPESASDFSGLSPDQSVVFALEVEAGAFLLSESLDGGPHTVTNQGTVEVVDDNTYTVTPLGAEPITIEFDFDGQTLTQRWALTDAEIQQLFASTSAPYFVANAIVTIEAVPYTRVE
jgi:TRAP-type C4-dicarboxylate transport system substrate-binding protein